MFDTPDLGPLCYAPFVAIFSGFFVYGIGSVIGQFIQKRTGKKPAGWNDLIIFLVMLIIPLSCIASVFLEIGAFQPAPWFDPTANSIAGKWELTKNNIDFMEGLKIPIKPHELVFNSDGTFYVTNIPTFWGLFDDANKKWNAKYMSGSGIWHLEHVQWTREEVIVIIEFQKIDGQSIDTNHRSHHIRFFFIGHIPPYELRSVDGDLGFSFRKKSFINQ
jgi:hypothetical protein